MHTSKPIDNRGADEPTADLTQNPLPDPFDGIPKYDENFDPVAMLDAIVSHLRQYLLCDEYQYTILALWIVHTWTFEEFAYAAYLDIRSPEPQSGKTLCLQLLRELSDLSWFAPGPSPATLSKRLLEDRTTAAVEMGNGELFHHPPFCYLLDDCDQTFVPSGRQTLIAMLNSGVRKGCRFMSGSQEYQLFGPKAFAGNAPLPHSLASRCIPILLRRKKSSEVVARFRPLSPLSPEVTELRNSMDLINPEWIGEFADETPSGLPVHLTPHQQNCAEPLIHIADAIGGPWPARARVAIAAAFQLSDSSLALQMLQDVRTCFHINNNPDYLATRDLLSALISHDDRPWKSWTRSSGQRLAALLQPFGIHSHWLRNEDGNGLRGYRFKDFEDTWERYLPPSSLPEQGHSSLPISATDAACNVAATAFLANAVADVSLNSQ